MDYLLKKRLGGGLCLLALLIFAVLSVIRMIPELREEASEGELTRASVVQVLNEELPGEEALTEIWSFALTALGKREVADFSVIRDEDGYLHYGSFYRERNPRLFEYASRVARLAEAVAPEGTKVLYVSPPPKYLRQAVQLAPGMQASDLVTSVQELLYYLFRMGVASLDMTDEFLRSDTPYLRNFYRTDRNWTVDAAFRATGLLVEKIRETWGEELDPEGVYTDPDSYRVKTYPERMLGSMGRTAGMVFAPPEEFRLYLPRFENEYLRETADGRERETFEGSFREALLDMDILDEDRSVYSRTVYHVYLDGYNDFDRIVNLSAGEEQGRRMLVVCDSYFSPVVAFLAPMCSVIDRVYNLYDGEEFSVEALLAENHYDYVVIEVYPNNLDSEAFHYFEEGENT